MVFRASAGDCDTQLPVVKHGPTTVLSWDVVNLQETSDHVVDVFFLGTDSDTKTYLYVLEFCPSDPLGIWKRCNEDLTGAQYIQVDAKPGDFTRRVGTGATFDNATKSLTGAVHIFWFCGHGHDINTARYHYNP